MNTSRIKQDNLLFLDVTSRHGTEDEDIVVCVNNIKRLLNNNDDLKLINKSRENPLPEDIESKSDPITLSAIALAFLSGGAATALINAISSALSSTHNTSLSFKVTDPATGREISFSAENLNIDQVSKQLDDFDLFSQKTFSKTKSSK